MATAFWELKSCSDLTSVGTTSYCLATFPSTSTKKCRVSCKAEGGKSFRFGTKKAGEESDDTNESSGGNGALNFGTQMFGSFGTRGVRSEESLDLVSASKKTLSLGILSSRASDSKTVFVAGATGQIGARISQQLLRSGFTVRGGVRDIVSAQKVAEFATQYGVISKEEARRLNAVEFDFEDAESIAKAIGNAGRVVVTVGPTEDGPRGNVSAKDALQVVEAATMAKVGHVVVVAEDGGGSSKNGPLAAIAGFFSKLFSQAAEVTSDSLLSSVVETDLRFTFVKAGSTQSVDDFSPDGNSVVLLSEGTYTQGTSKVSKAQLASTIASIVSNVSLAENKVLEVAAINTESPKPVEEFLSLIPVDGRRGALAEARAKAEAEEEERRVKEEAEAEARRALEEAKQAAQVARELEQEANKLAAEEARAIANAQRAKEKAKAAAASFEEIGAKMKQLGISLKDGGGGGGGGGFGNLFRKAPEPAAVVSEVEDDVDDEEEEQPKKGAGFPSFFNRAGPSKSKVKTPAAAPVRAPAAKTTRPRTKVVKEEKKNGQPKLFGGLFKQQETIYVDE